jgi:hypothetical protein
VSPQLMAHKTYNKTPENENRIEPFNCNKSYSNVLSLYSYNFKKNLLCICTINSG